MSHPHGPQVPRRRSLAQPRRTISKLKVIEGRRRANRRPPDTRSPPRSNRCPTYTGRRRRRRSTCKAGRPLERASSSSRSTRRSWRKERRRHDTPHRPPAHTGAAPWARLPRRRSTPRSSPGPRHTFRRPRRMRTPGADTARVPSPLRCTIPSSNPRPKRRARTRSGTRHGACTARARRPAPRNRASSSRRRRRTLRRPVACTSCDRSRCRPVARRNGRYPEHRGRRRSCSSRSSRRRSRRRRGNPKAGRSGRPSRPDRSSRRCRRRPRRRACTSGAAARTSGPCTLRCSSPPPRCTSPWRPRRWARRRSCACPRHPPPRTRACSIRPRTSTARRAPGSRRRPRRRNRPGRRRRWARRRDARRPAPRRHGRRSRRVSDRAHRTPRAHMPPRATPPPARVGSAPRFDDSAPRGRAE